MGRTTLLLTLATAIAWGQRGPAPLVGRKASEVSPEIVRQMQRKIQDADRRESGALPSEEMLELERLRIGYGELRVRIAANAKKYAELESFVSTLDISIDTRLLTEARLDIRELKVARQKAEEDAKAAREADRAVIVSIKTGLFMLLFGFFLSVAAALMKWLLLDPRRRKVMVAEAAKDSQQVADIVGAIDIIRREVLATRDLAQAAKDHAEQVAIRTTGGAGS